MYPKSATTLFTKQKSIAPLSELSNEILCILVAKGATERSENVAFCQRCLQI